jgi:hypothetical protein
MKKAKIFINKYHFQSSFNYYAKIEFDSRQLHSPELMTKDYKRKSGALKAGIKICEDFGLDYEVVK